MADPDATPAEDADGVALWGGLECTVNRVGDRFFSQLERNPASCSPDDLGRIAALGIRTLRFPVLWERVAPDEDVAPDWSWSDTRLARLRHEGVRPIVGLVHHGSGPRHTSLVDPQFPEKLAAYGASVARRYPWVTDYTPVNEPLTTARFSGLYGIWYPHGRDEPTFWQALRNQCRGTVLAMRAIRAVNPGARLVQTDDLGKTYATPLLQYQARFNNHLRWLSWDLLRGSVEPGHPLWRWLLKRCGARREHLQWFIDNPCTPDVIGVNYYVTSERFLDEGLEKYPPHTQGGNQRHCYADLEAVVVSAIPSAGIAPLLQECWSRYRLPIAVTEAHIDARRDDQMRWLAEIWLAATQARTAGADVRAVTVWGMLGLYDWNCLLTDCRDYYESGAFDARATPPRPTAVAGLARALARGELPDHPVLSGVGWWRRPVRLAYPPMPAPGRGRRAPRPTGGNVSPILITGATGTLGRAFARVCADRGLNHQLLRRDQLDITDPASIERALDAFGPWAVVNAAGYVRVDEAENDVERCFLENTLGPSALAAASARHGLPLVTFSSDLVFDGLQQAPYVESDGTAPLSVYGRSKAEAEARVLDLHPSALVVRTSSFFGPWDEHNFITVALRELSRGRSFLAAHDVTVSPTYVPDLVHNCLDLLIDGECGLWHLSNGQPVTWAALARRAAALAGVDARHLQTCRNVDLRLRANRPQYSALGSHRSIMMPSLDDALRRYVGQRAA